MSLSQLVNEHQKQSRNVLSNLIMMSEQLLTTLEQRTQQQEQQPQQSFLNEWRFELGEKMRAMNALIIQVDRDIKATIIYLKIKSQSREFLQQRRQQDNIVLEQQVRGGLEETIRIYKGILETVQHHLQTYQNVQEVQNALIQIQGFLNLANTWSI
eukprot:GILJ01018724.1.p2 GENE.GILJ01018724.1~~GILJ01018724.1.p2  ORF type:complete len:156 (-),score=23.88 GILJ01018724.1:70-537(-)